MNFDPNPLFYHICNIYSKYKTADNKLTICNEGSSRSSKTWDFYHFLVAFCSQNKDQEIYILRDTLVNCRDYTMKEFVSCLKVIGIYDEAVHKQYPKPEYYLCGNKIYFRGLDDEKNTEGYPSDVIFINEALETSKEKVMGLIMRCRKLVVMDWNPKFTEHWCFDFEGRKDVYFTKTTYKNNKHLQKSIIKEIESYNPYHPEDNNKPESERRPHPINVPQGTADLYRWKVYGLGERAMREGLVFNDVNYIDTFPVEYDEIAYGLDFGETAESALVRCAIVRKYPRCDLYLEKIIYTPTTNSGILIELMSHCNIKGVIYSDNNQVGWVSDIRAAGYEIIPTRKFAGSREYWISSINRCNIHIIKDKHFKKEQENFSYRILDGRTLTETIKKFDHLWSASGYAVVGAFRDIINAQSYQQSGRLIKK